MTISGAGMTAKMIAAGRAQESRRPDRLFDGPLAQALAGEDGFRWMEEMRPPGAPAENPSIGPRTWFFDQLITRAAGHGRSQVVLLAAGTDTRAFRLPLPAQAIVYELDDPAVLADKQAILDREHAAPRCTRRPVAADLVGAKWPASLAAAGFNPGARRSSSPKDSPGTCPNRPSPSCWTRRQASPPRQPTRRRHGQRRRPGQPGRRPILRASRSPRRPLAVRHPRPRRLLDRPGWQADLDDMYAVAHSLGRWPPPGVPADIADHAAAASPNWFISATRVP
jgi:hypothetical protein